MFTFVYTALYDLVGFTRFLVFAAHQQLPHILEKETPQLHISLYTLLLLISSSFHYFFIWMYFFVTYLLIVFWGTGRREMLLPGNCLLLVQMYWGFEKVFQVFWNWGMWTSWSLDWVRSILTGCVLQRPETTNKLSRLISDDTVKHTVWGRTVDIFPVLPHHMHCQECKQIYTCVCIY